MDEKAIRKPKRLKEKVNTTPKRFDGRNKKVVKLLQGKVKNTPRRYNRNNSRNHIPAIKTLTIADILDKFENDPKVSPAAVERIIKKLTYEELIILRISLEKKKLPIDNEARKKFANYKIGIFIIVISYFLVFKAVINSLGWSIMEPNVTLIFMLSQIFSITYILIRNETFSLKDILEKKRKSIYNDMYKKFDFNIELYNYISDQIDKLKR